MPNLELPAGFITGVNLPWMRYGCDFGANAWQADGGIGQPDRRGRLREVLARLAGDGTTLVRWFVLCDGRAGLRESPDGLPSGLDDFVLRDLDAAVEELDRAPIRAMLVLLDFHWCRPRQVVNGVLLGGRSRALGRPDGRARLLDSVLAPILDRYSRSGAVAAWDIINEPDWVTGRFGRWHGPGIVSRGAMRAFISEAVGLVHGMATQPVTVGSASTRSLSLMRDLGLDFYQAHWYDRHDRHSPLDRPVAVLGLDRPVLLGEFPTRNSSRPPADIVEIARLRGYAGALAWPARSDDPASGGFESLP